MIIATNLNWYDADGEPQDISRIKKEVVNYSEKGGIIFVGADSMLDSKVCVFAAVIAFHDKDQDIAKYYYKKIKSKEAKYKDVKLKILEEVNLAIQCAHFIVSFCPQANLELHVDISTKRTNLTSRFYNLVKGWVSGLGFNLKVKPESWASSSIADWHTK